MIFYIICSFFIPYVVSAVCDSSDEGVSVTFLERTVGFKHSELTLGNLEKAFDTTNIDYLEDANTDQFFPFFDGSFSPKISKKVFLRQFIPKSEPLKIFAYDARTLTYNTYWYSGKTPLTVGLSSPSYSYMYSTLIRFNDLSKIDNTKKIHKAYLRLFGYSPTSNIPVEIFVHRIDEDWSNPIYFYQQPMYRIHPYSSTLVTSTAYIPYFWDVTDLVKSWVTKSSPNYGILLKTNDTYSVNQYTYKNFNNHEAVNKPCMLVFYEPKSNK